VPDACPFCELLEHPSTHELNHPLVVALRDANPVSPGHTLIIPKAHVATYFDADPALKSAIWQAVDVIKTQLDTEYSATGYNIGINAGRSAGQTVMHLHVHVIPRFDGDVDDPTGGVRGVIPAKQHPETGADVADGLDPFIGLREFTDGRAAALGAELSKALLYAEQISLLSAFIQPSGLQRIQAELTQAAARGANIRVLTGDYLAITHPDALRDLLAQQQAHPEFHAKLYQDDSGRPFHPKAYLFTRGNFGVAYVGSSNLSRPALTNSVEWNHRTVRRGAGTAFDELVQSFDALWHDARAKPLTRALIDAYAEEVRERMTPEPRRPRNPPNLLQQEALAALAATREADERRGLVVMATGGGKTYLSALDCEQLGASRTLFIAHRKEILTQAQEAWVTIFPDRQPGLMVDGMKAPDADMVFASVQTLVSGDTLAGFAPNAFDYIVVDEFHHAAASTYRRVLTHFKPKFMLGLTATPDRMDGASLTQLCNDNVVYTAGLVRAVKAGILVPFHYFGVPDSIDFRNIPWKDGRFELTKLTQEANARAGQVLHEYRDKTKGQPGQRRVLAFCCTIEHADFMARFFREHGIKAVAVHSHKTSAPRDESLDRLGSGDLEIICAVDIFNEGVDVPNIDVVLMLRPTLSPVIYLQQIGRGLRKPKDADKRFLTVVDFIGNHRSFMSKPAALLSLMGISAPGLAGLGMIERGELNVEGCEVHIETEALDMLRTLAKASKDDMLVYEYTQLRDTHGRRPSAGEVFMAGVHMKPVKERYGTWFDFVEKMETDGVSDLSGEELRVHGEHAAWFGDLMSTRLGKSWRMVVVRALLDMGGLHGEVDVGALAVVCEGILKDDPVLRFELAELEVGDGGGAGFEGRWREAVLRQWHEAKSVKRQWFVLDGEVFRSRLAVAEGDRAVFDEMTAELVDLRLRECKAKLRGRLAIVGQSSPIRIKVSHTRGEPILRFDRKRNGEIPGAGEDQRVWVDGVPYLFGFRKIAVNVVRERLGGPNIIGQLMRTWFGVNAGLPGSQHWVELVRHGEGWTLRKDGGGLADAAGAKAEDDDLADVIPFPKLPFFADLAVACGPSPLEQHEGADARGWLRVESKFVRDPKLHFVVRASGDSMDRGEGATGGELSIRDGDLVLCEWVSATEREAVQGRPCLLSGYDGEGAGFALIKEVVWVDGKAVLRSWGAGVADRVVEGGGGLRVAARVLEVVVEASGPRLWGQYTRDEAAALFGKTANRSWQRGHVDIEAMGRGHSLLFVNLRKDAKVEPEQRYADRFLGRDEFRWESEASTAPTHKKGRSIGQQQENGQLVHLFVRSQAKDGGETLPFVYCGLVDTVSCEGAKPMRVGFRLRVGLPDGLWRLWG